ncbi:fungal specific transcription factor domain containing protein [Pyrenophora tritici-repentis]|nr:fungal specific transcription factor domain containing protein [Pyrenophora tritici-repentis]
MSASSSSTQNVAHGFAQTPPSGGAEQKSHPPQPRVRRRNRLITSCLECRRRKLKCDKANPCTHCTKTNRKCVFIASGMDADAQAKLAEVKERMGMLEKSLEEDVVLKRKPSIRTTSECSRLSVLPGQEQQSDQEDEEDTRDLRPTNLVTEDSAYCEPEEDFNDDMVDLGFRIGKLRITDRVGGLVRPRFSDELAQSLNELPLQASPSRSFIDEDPINWLAPTSDYIAPSSNFILASGVDRALLESHLPARAVVDRLIANYWIRVHPIARTVHRPSFERQYQNFWIRMNMGMKPRSSFQAVLFAALLSSMVSMSADTVRNEYGAEKRTLVDNFREGAEAALVKANFLRTAKLETLQAFVMYLIPLCRNEVSRAHSALVGSLIRLAECMGLHRDPTAYSTSSIETQVRRVLWFQICFLDIRTCDAVGPRPHIRLDDYDTRFPLNIDDSFQAAMEKKYVPMLGKSEPLHVLASELHGIFSNRLYISLLQRYITAARNRLPERLRQLTLSAATMILEHGMTVEQDPVLSAWSWIVGALHQHHCALLLVNEVYIVNPEPAMEQRIWRCLDYSFDIPSGLSNVQKIRLVLEELIWKSKKYAEMTGVRAPNNMPQLSSSSSKPPSRQREENTNRIVSHSDPNTSSKPVLQNNGLNNKLNPPRFVPPHQLKQQLLNASALAPGINAFPGSMPTVSWGNFNMPDTFPSSMLISQQLSFGDFAPMTNPASGGGAMANAVRQAASGNSSPNSASYAGNMMAGSVGSDTMDAINDIDWNDVERMFGSAELGAGNMLIPPFTFPQFSAEHLRAPLGRDGV